MVEWYGIFLNHILDAIDLWIRLAENIASYKLQLLPKPSNNEATVPIQMEMDRLWRRDQQQPAYWRGPTRWLWQTWGTGELGRILDAMAGVFFPAECVIHGAL